MDDDERVVDTRLTMCVLLCYRSLMYDDHVTPLRVMTNAGTVRARMTFELVQQSRFEADARARYARRWIRMTNVRCVLRCVGVTYTDAVEKRDEEGYVDRASLVTRYAYATGARALNRSLTRALPHRCRLRHTHTGGLSKSRVVVDSDGFKYKKRKSTKNGLGVTIVEPRREVERYDASYGAGASASDDARGREDFHEKLPNNMPEDERMQMLCESICAAESAAVIPALKGEDAFAANAVTDALQEFQLRIEQLLIDEEVKFEQGPQTMAAKIEARKAQLRMLRDSLEQESTQWSCMLEGSAVPVAAETPVVDASELGPSEAGSLAEACEYTQRRLILQAEGARGLVEGIESLCVRSERACSVFASAIAANDFRSLPAYQSPHRLISSLIGGGR